MCHALTELVAPLKISCCYHELLLLARLVRPCGFRHPLSGNYWVEISDGPCFIGGDRRRRFRTLRSCLRSKFLTPCLPRHTLQVYFIYGSPIFHYGALRGRGVSRRRTTYKTLANVVTEKPCGYGKPCGLYIFAITT